jgi:hypothetical protein
MKINPLAFPSLTARAWRSRELSRLVMIIFVQEHSTAKQETVSRLVSPRDVIWSVTKQGNHLILTRFQPGGQVAFEGRNRFNGFRFRWLAKGKQLKRFSEIR